MKFYKTLFIALLLLNTSLFAQKYPTLNIGQKMPMQEVKIFPCILVNFYANDIEFGEIYRFTGVEISDFHESIIK